MIVANDLGHVRTGFFRKLTAVFAMALLTLGNPAQASVTAATASGVVETAQGEPVSGATVKMVHDPSGTSSTASTSEDGRFNLRGLRVGGPYTITVTSDTYRTTVLNDQYLQLGNVDNIRVVVETKGQAVEEIVVTGTAIGGTFDAARMGSGTNLDGDRILSLPSIGRNIQDMIRTDPRISQVDKERGEISAGGQNSRFNNIRIDGVSTNDGFGLEGNNLPTFRQPIPLDSIESLNISLNNFDVAISGYTGASVDAVTKSGTNEFSGSAYYVMRDSDWTGERDGNKFNGFEDEETRGFTLGGPILKDKLFFFMSAEEFTRSALAPQFGPAGSDAAQIVSGISVQDITEIQQIANSFGFDAGSFETPGSLDTEVQDLMTKIDWNINDNHRASFRWNRTQQDDPYLRGIGGRSLSLSSYWHVNNKEFESFVGHLFSDWTPNFSTEFRASRSNQSSTWDIGNPLPSIRICLNSGSCSGADSVYLGTERFRHVNIVEVETTNFFAAGTYYAGAHEIKVGADYESRDIFNLFGRDQFGTYEFFGIDRFRAGTPDNYTLFYPTQGDVSTRAAAWKLENLGLFVQDTWNATDRLTLTAGVRVDVPMVGDEPAFNQTASDFFGSPNNATVDGNYLIQPRFGFNYQADFSRPTQFRGGVGLFQGIAANVWLSNPFTNNNIIQSAIFLDGDAGVQFSADPDNQPGVRPPPGLGGNVDFLDPDLKLPSVWKMNLAVDHELPWWGVVASAELLVTEVEQGIRYIKPNLGDATGTAPDGRPIYWSVTDPASFTGSRGQAIAGTNRDFGRDSTIAVNTDKGNGRQLTLSLQSPDDSNWYWNVAYTYTEATEVSPLTSSQASSNWNNAVRYDPNADIAENSYYAFKDRFTATVSYTNDFIKGYDTSVGLFYEGRVGRPFTYTFINDANGDTRVNDPFYVPGARGDVLFTGGADMENAFFQYLDSNGGLAQYAGDVAEINGANAPWIHQVDLRITQQIPGLFSKHRGEFWVDVMNLGNLLNEDWGQIEEVGFPGAFGVARMAGIDPDTGKYVYNFNENSIRDLNLRDNVGESRWAAQVGIRYKF